MKLLIVEDQAKTGQYLRQGLTEAGFNTELVADGNSGQQLALTGDYALLILDVMLPGRSGWQILQAVRSAGLDTPVLFSRPKTPWKTGFTASNWALMIIWSNPSPSPSYWRGCAVYCVVAAPRRRKPVCKWPICVWI